MQGDFIKPILEEQRQVDAAERQKDRQTDFFAARKFIYTIVNLFISYTDVCLHTLVAVGRCSKKSLFWISRSNPLKNNCEGFIFW